MWAQGFSVMGGWICGMGPSRKEREAELLSSKVHLHLVCLWSGGVKLKARKACTSLLGGGSWLSSFHKDSVTRL